MLTGASLQLTDDPAPDRSPSWLPDGSAILFVSSRGGKTAIWKTPRLGGPAVLVVENAEDHRPTPGALPGMAAEASVAPRTPPA